MRKKTQFMIKSQLRPASIMTDSGGKKIFIHVSVILKARPRSIVLLLGEVLDMLDSVVW